MSSIVMRALYSFNIEKQGSSALFWAARHDKLRTAQFLLQVPGATADVVSEGNTPLIVAAKFGSQLVMELLLQNPSTRLNATNPSGQTALWCAAAENHSITVSRLLQENRVLVNCPDVVSGWTPLAVAVLNGHRDVVQCFLSDDRADVNTVDKHSRTPLFHAVQYDRSCIMEMLLTDTRTDVTHRDSRGCTPLLDAAQRGFYSSMNILLKRPDIEVNVYDSFSLSPLWYAVGFRSVDTAQQLLDRGATAHIMNGSHSSPLQRAISLEHMAMIRMFLQHPGLRPSPGASDVGSRLGPNPLFTAVLVGRSDILELLLSSGLDTNVQDEEGKTPLALAASIGHYEDVKQLLHHQNTNPSIPDYDGWTALHEAAIHGRLSVVKLLLSNSKVNVNAKDEHGQTPLWWATFRMHPCVAQWLLHKDNINVNAIGLDQTTSLHHVVQAGNIAITRALLQRENLDPNALDRFGYSPLRIAVYNGDIPMVQLLLTRKDLLLNNDSPAQRPPIYGSERWKRWKLVQTPLMIAIKEGYCQIAILLLQRTGSRINFQNWRGETALLLAARGGHTEVGTVHYGGPRITETPLLYGTFFSSLT
ncbi:ankyrin repeat-containing domain protein [Aspergillus pseudonomiae]|nr:ankyrin repeat-containing domain protein [Aspergillus pseudonomiae]